MMNRYTFNVVVKTDKVLHNEDKTEVMEAIKSQVERIRKAGGYLLHDADILVSREVSIDDIAEALK